MTQDKTERHVMFASAILLLLFVGLTLFVVSIVQANPGPDSAASRAAFRTKCAMCHGPDGSGSEVGKSMNVPDLRSAAVQKLPDAQLAQTISDGKGGMPPFKSSLSGAQIHALVSHIRSLQQKKQSHCLSLGSTSEISVTNLTRRLFLGRATASLAALGAMSSGANPQLVDKRSDWEIAEFGRLVKNPYRVKQVFDENRIGEGEFRNNIKNSLNGLHFGFNIPSKQIKVIAAMHGPANALNFDDYILAKISHRGMAEGAGPQKRATRRA